MLESTEIIEQLMSDIINGKMNLQQTKDEIRRLEVKYGHDFFISYDYDEAKPKPWDDEYLKELEIKSIAGMSSKQFILHLAEVSEDIHAKRAKKKRISVLVVIAVAVAIGIYIGLVNHRENVQNKSIQNKIIQNCDYSQK